MLHFDSDYMAGAHPAILEKLAETNFEQTPGYGTDAHCERARELVRSVCECPEAEVFFLVGGTQTNATIIDALLHRTQGAISADTGHIATHEAGAIEAGGHKVLAIPHTLGKIDAEGVRSYCAWFFGDANHEHMVEPGVVYLSYPTEYGTIYTKDELEAIASVCREYHLPLFIDGARMGYGLAAEGADLTLPDIARLCDVFYIGGTKVGALFGEAVVFTKPELANRFFTLMKQHGALLAKGRLLGIHVRDAARKRPVPRYSAPCRQPGHEAQGGVYRKRLRAGHRFAHQPAIRRARRPDESALERTRNIRLLGSARRRSHRRSLRHQLGHS